MKLMAITTTLMITLLGLTSTAFIKAPEFSMTRPEVKKAINVYGTQLTSCCTDPMTGYYRDGHCVTGAGDVGTHVVCAVMTREFLDYTKAQGNDLCTARPEYRFPGLEPGDKWCLCAVRWVEAYKAGVAPKIDLQSTDIKMLDYVSLEELIEYSYEG